MDQNNCCICLEEVEDFINCSNTECNVLVCYDCAENYISFCNTEFNTTPICPNKNCNCEYLYENVKYLNDDTVIIFSNIIYTIIKNETKIHDINAKKEMLEKFTDEKHKFMKENLPKCVILISEICFKEKIKISSKNFIDNFNNITAY